MVITALAVPLDRNLSSSPVALAVGVILSLAISEIPREIQGSVIASPGGVHCSSSIQRDATRVHPLGVDQPVHGSQRGQVGVGLGMELAGLVNDNPCDRVLFWPDRPFGVINHTQNARSA